MRRRTTWAVVPLAALAGACGEAEPPALTVGPASFTEDQLLGLSDARRQTLAELTAFGLAVADSATAELGAPEIERAAEDRLLDVLSAELTLEKHGLGDAALREAYAAAPEWELTVTHLLVFSERWRDAAHREAAAARARRALEMLRAGRDFAEVEAALAAEPGAEARAGRMPPGREGTWVPEFWAAALALEPGELSPVTETQYGFHVIRLEERTTLPFEEARSAVARRVAGGVDDPARVLADWLSGRGAEGAGGRETALAEARARGLEVPPAERAELAREWEDRTAQWAAALGFAYGLPPDRVAGQALAALGDRGQSAELARRELAAHGDLLTALYPIGGGTEAPPGP